MSPLLRLWIENYIRAALYGVDPSARTGDVVHIREWLDGPWRDGQGEGEADPGGWEANRESSLYFDRLWLSEIGIKG